MRNIFRVTTIILLLVSFGCSRPLDERLAGSWQSINGPRMSLIFQKGGSLKLVLYAGQGVPFDVESSGSYTITGGKTFTILDGGEYSDGKMESGELSITKRGGLTSRFRKSE